jgi:hypothetical protein
VFHLDRIGPVWDPGQRGITTALAAVLLIALLLAGACSGEENGERSTAKTDNSEESTPTSPTTGPETTESAPLPEATLGAEPDSPDVVLRLEGDPKTTFSGICTVGGKESVLSGRVPKRYAFDPKGQKLSCRIQKQDSGGGSLKVILIAGNTTRSVQQTNARGGVINLSYQSS